METIKRVRTRIKQRTAADRPSNLSIGEGPNVEAEPVPPYASSAAYTRKDGRSHIGPTQPISLPIYSSAPDFESLYIEANEHVIALYEQLQSARSSLERKDAELAVSEEAASAFKSRTEVDEQKLREFEELRAQMQDKITALADEAANQQAVTTRAQADLHSLSRSYSKVLGQKRTLKGLLESSKQALAEAASNLRNLEAESAAKDQQLQGMLQLERDLQAAHTVERASKRERRTLREQCERHEATVNELRQKLQVARTKVNELSFDLTSVKAHLKTVETERTDLKGQLAQATSDLHELLNASTSAQVGLETQLQTARDKSDTAIRLAEDLKNDRDAEQAMRIRLQADLKLCDSKLEQANASMQRLQQSLTEVKHEREILEADLAALRKTAKTEESRQRSTIQQLGLELDIAHSSCGDLGKARASAVSDLERLQSLNADLRSQLEVSSASIEQLSTQAESFKALENKTQRDLESQRHSIAQLEEARMNLLRQQQDQAEDWQRKIYDTERAAAKQHLTDLDEIRQLRSANRDLFGRLEALTQLESDSDTRSSIAIQNLTLQLAAVNNGYGQTFAYNTELQERLKLLQAEHATDKDRLLSALAEIDIAQGIAEALRSRLQDASASEMAAREQLSSSSTALLDTQIALANLQDALQIARADASYWKTESDKARSRHYELNLDLERLQNENEALQQELAAANEVTEGFQHLQQQFESLRNDARRSDEAKRALEESVAVYESQMTVFQSQGDDLQIARSSVDSRTEEVSKLRSTLEDFQSAAEASRKQFAKVEAELADAQRQLQALSQLQSDFDTLSKEAAENLEEKKFLGDRLVLSHAEKERLESQLAVAQDARAKLGNECFILESARDDLQLKLSELEQSQAQHRELLQQRKTDAGRLVELTAIAVKILDTCQTASASFQKSSTPNKSQPKSPPASPVSRLESILEEIAKQTAIFEVYSSQFRQSQSQSSDESNHRHIPSAPVPTPVPTPEPSTSSNNVAHLPIRNRVYGLQGLPPSHPIYQWPRASDWPVARRDYTPSPYGWQQASNWPPYGRRGSLDDRSTSAKDNDLDLNDWNRLRNMWQAANRPGYG